MLHAAFARFEVRVRSEAPTLLEDLRALAALALPSSATVAVGSSPSSGGPGEGLGPDPSAARSRYEDLGLLGRGGMGEVRRVRDLELNRVVAMKQVRADAASPALLARLLEEVQTTAQLQHPGIVPVYDAGRTSDGGVYFTMKEVRGRELAEVIRSVHQASRQAWEETADGWSLRRVVSALAQAAQAVGYAHERGVVHRDLKPANVMVGSYGEVLVMDWGLAKVVGRAEVVLDAVEAVAVERSRAATRVGRVMGTPAYMSPEQAAGDVAGTDVRSDVYALGAMLYEALTGHPPYEGATGAEVVARVLEGPPAPVRGAPRHASGGGGSLTVVSWQSDGSGSAPEVRPSSADARGLSIPAELAAACERAMARAPADRFETATSFAEALQSWLDGSRRRAQALAVVERAADRRPEAAALRARAAALRAEAEAELKGIAGWQPEEEKAGAWAKEDEAAALEARAALADLEEESLLRGSLTHAPDLPEAHAALAERHRAEHAAAEAARASSARPEALLRAHLAALPDGHPTQRSGFAYLQGDGALTLLTDPPGAEVELYRYVERSRRLVAVPERSLGRTPLRAVSLPRGSWLCLLRHPDRSAAGADPVRYPVFLGRGEHWDGVPPEGGEPLPVPLPPPGALGPDDRYVPAGWFWSGGDPGALNGLPRRRSWVDGQVLRRFPVTNREYLAFLDALVAAGREEEALRHAPRERAGTVGEPGALIYGYDGERFSLRPDADGDVWDPEWPVFQVDWYGAAACAAWEAARTGQPWRLPGELPWEKAARGVDGRWFPWGDRFDASWARTSHSHRGRALPGVAGAPPVDESVYGIRGLGGNVRDWCADSWRADGPPIVGGRVADGPDGDAAGPYRVTRGGAWDSTPADARAASRVRGALGLRTNALGFRLSRPFP